VIVSNCDLHIGDEPELPKAYGGNNHGSIIEINGKWYIFYHRQTNGTWYSRQGCLEPIEILEDGSIPQVEMTSCGPNGGPLPGKGEYPAYIACHIFDKERHMITGAPNSARVTQDGRDGDEEPGYVANIHDGTVVGFKYFDFEDVNTVTLMVRGYGWGGTLHVKTSKFGPALASMKLENTNIWTPYTAPITLPKGKSPLYITYEGGGSVMLKSVIFE